MKDCFNRDIEEGNLVAVAGSSTSTPFLSIGRVIGPCKKGSGIRVRVLHSNSLAFERGHRKWRAEEMTREQRQPYVATFQRSDRLLVIDGLDLPLPAEET